MRIILICLTLGVFDNTYGQNSIFLIKDINQGSGSSDPKKFTPVGENVFFVANESEVWRTDGTEEGTFLIKDTLNNEISFGRFGKSLTVMNGEVYFVVDNNSLWKSDGSENGLVRIGGFSSQSNQIQDVGNTILVSTDTHVFFKMNDTELWAVESGESTAELVRDFNSMFNPFSFGPIEMVEYKGRVIFGASDADTEIVIDHEPYISDGTLSGTFKLKDVFQNSGDANGQGSSPSNFSVVGESVYFTAGERGNSKPSLHISDGTEVGTSSLKLLDGQILGNFSEFDDQLIFTQNGNQIWKSTGTSIGTEFVKTVGTGVSSSSITSGSVLPSENMFYFFANLGAELWKSDGSSDGTFLIESFADNPAPHAIVTKDQRLLFTVKNGPRNEIWESDGTSEGTVPFVQDDLLSVNSIFEFGDQYLLSASSSEFGSELFLLRVADEAQAGSQEEICFPVEAGSLGMALICL